MPRHEYLYGQTLPQLEALCNRLEMPRFAAKQIARWLYDKHATTIEAMSDLSARHRALLAETYEVGLTAPEKVSISTDGTKKYLYRTSQNHFIESAYIPDGDRATLCISSQAGCRMGCRFCASTLDGLERNLRPSEMLDQIYRIQSITGERVSNVVVMGSGEPMDNYDNVIRFLRLVSDEKGLNISQRSLTISTCGIVPGIRKFAEEGLAVTLALSLHAPNDEVRKTLMPVANSYKLQDVLEACHYYYEKTGRRLTFEYSLVRGVNDNLDEARALAKLIKDQHGHVNLIPVNPIKERDYVQSGQKAIQDFKNVFGENIRVFFVYNGTGANILSLSAFTHSYNAVICAETAHINVDECGAIEKQSGCKLLTVPTFDGKLTTGLIQNHMHGFGEQHHSQPKMISLTQCTELGTVYTPAELKEICDYAHAHRMYVHMDGARLSNAVAYLGCDPRDITSRVGIDVLSFGGTKNGMMFGEAVVFFNPEVAKEVQYIRKQLMQLHSKTRFIAAQFSAVLKHDLWLKTAGHANRMARMLANEAAKIPGIRITQEVQGNEVFAIIPRDKITKLQSECFFYIWDENASEVRWVCSFDTTESDIIEFVNLLRAEIC